MSDQATNSIQTDNVNTAIQGNLAIWLNLVDNYGTDASGATWWPNFKQNQVEPLGELGCQLMQVAPPSSQVVTDAITATGGQIWNQMLVT